MKIYGPYTRKDGRKHVIIYDGLTRQTVSYPKFLLQEAIGRNLTSEETVDHIDGDFTNDDISNLQILTRSENSRKGWYGSGNNPAEYDSYICPTCDTDFVKLAKQVRANQIVKGKAGPFCSRSCAGKYSKNPKRV